MNSLEQLRIAVALAHTLPGAELRLHTGVSGDLVVSPHPAADIDPCTMRRVVIASRCPDVPDHAARVESMSLGGALDDLGGGVFRTVSDGLEQRWIATTLGPGVVADLLDLVGLDTVPEEAMQGRLKPDGDLGVTLLVITANDARFDHDLDEFAAQAAASMFTAELLRDAAFEVSVPDSATNERGSTS